MLSPRKSFFRMAALGAVALLVALALGGCGELDKEKRFYEREQEFLEKFSRDSFEAAEALPSWFGEAARSEPEKAVNSEFLAWLHNAYGSQKLDLLHAHEKFTVTLLEELSQGKRPPPAYYRAFCSFLKEVAIPNARLLARRSSWFADYAADALPAAAKAEKVWQEYAAHAEQTLEQLEKDQKRSAKAPAPAEENPPQIDIAWLFSASSYPPDPTALPLDQLSFLSLPAITPTYLREFEAAAERSNSLHQAILARHLVVDDRPLFQQRYILAQRLYALNMQQLLCGLAIHRICMEMLQEQAASGQPVTQSMYRTVFGLSHRGLYKVDLLRPGYPKSSRLEFLPADVHPDMESMLSRLEEYGLLQIVYRYRLGSVLPGLR